MTTQVKCPALDCGKQFTVASSERGQRMQCPFCGLAFLNGGDTSAETKAAESAVPGASDKGRANGALTPELLQWAREQINEEETIAGLCEIRQTGGLQLSDFIEELERELTPRE